MNKKIISILFLLIVLISITFVYSYYNNIGDDVKHYNLPDEIIDENIITEEIDNLFIEENDEIEIGDMV
jgi:hypothetical protein